MAETSLATIQTKITALEEQLTRLKIAESELRALDGRTVARAMPAAPVKRGRPRKEPVAAAEASEDGAKQSVASRIREYLRANGPVPMTAIKEALGLEGRPVSFTLQALKRAGEAKNVGGEWSVKGRRKAV